MASSFQVSQIKLCMFLSLRSTVYFKYHLFYSPWLSPFISQGEEYELWNSWYKMTDFWEVIQFFFWHSSSVLYASTSHNIKFNLTATRTVDHCVIFSSHLSILSFRYKYTSLHPVLKRLHQMFTSQYDRPHFIQRLQFSAFQYLQNRRETVRDSEKYRSKLNVKYTARINRGWVQAGTESRIFCRYIQHASI